MLSKLVQDFHETETAMLEAQAAMDRGTRNALQVMAATWLTKFWGGDAWREILLLNPQYSIDIEARTVSVLIPFDWSELAPCVFYFWMKGPNVQQISLSLVTSNVSHERLILVNVKSDDSPEMYRSQFLRELTKDLAGRRERFEASNEKRRLEAVHRARPSNYGLGNMDGPAFREAVAAMRAAGATDAEVESMALSWNTARAKVEEDMRQAQAKSSAQAAARRDVLDWLARVRPVLKQANAVFEVYYRSKVPVKFVVCDLDYGVSTDDGAETRTVRVLVPEDGDLTGNTFAVAKWGGWEKRTFRHIVSISAPRLIDGKEEDWTECVYPIEESIDSALRLDLRRNRLVDREAPTAWPNTVEAIKSLKWPRLSDGFERKYSPYFGDLRGFVNGMIGQWNEQQ